MTLKPIFCKSKYRLGAQLIARKTRKLEVADSGCEVVLSLFKYVAVAIATAVETAYELVFNLVGIVAHLTDSVGKLILASQQEKSGLIEPKRTLLDRPTDVAIIERAMSLCSHACYTVVLQCRCLRADSRRGA